VRQILTELAIAADPALMMEMIGKPGDEWQKRLLRGRHSRLMLNCSRQAGKSTVTACIALLEVICFAPALVLVICPAARQSKEFLRNVSRFSKRLGVKSTQESTTHMEFANGSRILALPSEEETIRGFSEVGLLILDEASRIPDELYNSVKPMLAVSNGRIAILSTPYGKRGFFHKEWTTGEEWERVMVTAEQCPRITKSFLDKERRDLGHIFFRQEYMCEFAELTNAVFSFADVQAAMSTDIKPLFGGAIDPEVISDKIKPLFQ
jgi:hypothetical protein